MTILEADPSHRDRIGEIYRAAFDESEGETVADLAASLLAEASDPRPLHLLAKVDGKLVGHISFTPVRDKDGGANVGFILAPLAVDPAQQQGGVGSALVREGLRRLEDRQGQVVFVYGDPAYYGRFGFGRELAERYLPPCTPQYPTGWQALAIGTPELPAGPVTVECVAPLNAPELW